jgi:hypothetical protein
MTEADGIVFVVDDDPGDAPLSGELASFGWTSGLWVEVFAWAQDQDFLRSTPRVCPAP